MRRNTTQTKRRLVGISLTIILLLAGSALAAHAAGKPVSTITGSVVNGGNPVTLKIMRAGPAAPMTKINPKSGLFVVSGSNIGGPRTLVFVSQRKKYSMSVKVPVGGKLTLKDIQLKSPKVKSALSAQPSVSGGTAQADEEDITVDGTLTSVDCSASPNTVTVTTATGAIVTTAFDPATTEVVDQLSGQVITSCSDLSTWSSQPVEVEARMDPDGSLFALQITLNPAAGDQSGAELDGTIASTSCPDSITVTRSDGVSVVVNISSSTEIQITDAADDTSGTCADLSAGQDVKVEGTPQPDGSIDADSIEVRTTALESEGTIDSTSCASTPQSILFTPDGSSTALTVTIGTGTEIEVNDSPAACTDLTLAPADVEGVFQPDGSVAATKIEQDTSSGD